MLAAGFVIINVRGFASMKNLILAVLMPVVMMMNGLVFAWADESTSRWELPLNNFGTNLWDTHFDSRAIPFHLAAGASTYLLVSSNTDAKIQRWAAEHDADLSLAWSAPGLLGGAVVPFALPSYMLYSDEVETQQAGAAAMQAAAIALLSSSLIKALTNRQESEENVKATNAQSRDFDFGFLKQSVWGGFPSGHAATNMAMSAALAAYYPNRADIRLAAYSWAAYVALSAGIGDSGGVHWASDAVAGSLMGWIIGDMVGKRARYGADNNEESRQFFITPNLQNNGVMMIFNF